MLSVATCSPCRTAGKCGLAVLLGLLAVHFQPAGDDHDLAFGLERFAFDPRDARGHLKLRRRIKDGDESFGDHVVNRLLRRRPDRTAGCRWE